jgi:hypothetical protein
MLVPVKKTEERGSGKEGQGGIDIGPGRKKNKFKTGRQN